MTAPGEGSKESEEYRGIFAGIAVAFYSIDFGWKESKFLELEDCLVGGIDWKQVLSKTFHSYTWQHLYTHK